MRSILIALAVVAVAVCQPAAADSIVKRYAATADDQPSFVYEEATIATPIQVGVSTEEKFCTVRVALVGLQQGEVNVDTVIGRIEGGQCNGVPVSQGFVIAGVTRNGKLATLKRNLEILVFK